MSDLNEMNNLSVTEDLAQAMEQDLTLTQTKELIEESSLTYNVCTTCMHDNLLQRVGIERCRKCQRPFCIHFASAIDSLHYCVSCLSGVTLTKETIVKTVEHYNSETDTITRYSRRAKRISLAGEDLDWCFVARKIKEMTDAECEAAIEYHREYFQLLIDDAERRRTAKAHRNAGIKMAHPSTSSTTSTTVTTVKKTQTTTLDKQKAQVNALINSMLQNMSMDQLLGNLKKGGK